jgi:DNA polymerase III delta prime subunit
MLPIIAIHQSQLQLSDFLKDIQKKYQVSKIIEIQSQGKQITINQIREIKKLIIFAEKDPLLILINRFDLANFEAQNAFLKTLEEKSDKKIIVLTVENINKLIPTVISRCKIVDLTNKKTQLNNIPVNDQIAKLLQMVKSNTQFSFLGNNLIDNINGEKAGEIIKDIITILKNNLIEKDQSAVFLIKEGLKIKKLIEENNINPQLAIDNYLILINKVYNKNKDDKKNN